MGGVTGVRPARVLILGGGIVGTNAAQIAAGMGAEVLIADINLPRLRYLSEVMPKNVKNTLFFPSQYQNGITYNRPRNRVCPYPR